MTAHGGDRRAEATAARIVLLQLAEIHRAQAQPVAENSSSSAGARNSARAFHGEPFPDQSAPSFRDSDQSARGTDRQR